MGFTKARKEDAKLRLAICGPSGHGKTYTALAIASGLGKKIAVIDTENGSASKYADLFDFDVDSPANHSPETYVKMIKEAERAGYDVIVVDSLSHAWMGQDGALELVDKAAVRSRSQNRFTAWRDVTPMHNRLVGSMISSTAHIIATMRSKTAWEMVEAVGGKKKPVKIGLAPIQRDGIEFEFDLIGDMDESHNFIVSKTRFADLGGAVIAKPSHELGEQLAGWLKGEKPKRKKTKKVEPEEMESNDNPLVDDDLGISMDLMRKVDKAREMLPEASIIKVGGPDAAKPGWYPERERVDDFLAGCRIELSRVQEQGA